MRILGVDPGPFQSAYCFYEYGKPSYFGTEDNQDILYTLAKHAQSCDIDIVIEMIASYGMPVGVEVFETCVWIGRFIQSLENTAINKVERIFRKDVKLHLCGSARAKDSNVIQALKDRFGEKGTKKQPGLLYGIKADEWQSLALAVTYAETKL